VVLDFIGLPLYVSDFAPPRPSPSSLLLSSSIEGEVLGLTPSNWGHGAAEVPSTSSSSSSSSVLFIQQQNSTNTVTNVNTNEVEMGMSRLIALTVTPVY